MDAQADRTAGAALLLDVADAMAGRRRRKILPASPFLTYLVSTMVVVIAVGAIGFLLWRAWPTITAPLKTRRAADRSKKAEGAEHRKRAASEKPADAVAQLKRENEALRAENGRLRDQLIRTSETLSLRTAEVDELKLRLLILEKIRAGGPP